MLLYIQKSNIITYFQKRECDKMSNSSDYLYQFKKMSYTDYLESDIDSESLTAFYQKLKTQVFPNIVPVNFSLNYM